MKVLLFGANGMLGRAIQQVAPDDFETVPAVSRSFRCDGGDDSANVLGSILTASPDVVINAIGLRPGAEDFASEMAYINGVLPHLMAEECEIASLPFLHVSTDCAQAPHESLYAATKLAGESQYATNIRTSFVGPDHGLWRWVLDQAEKGETIEAWTRWMWSGSTVWAAAEGILEIVSDGLHFSYTPRTVNLATLTPIPKSDVIHTLRLLYAKTTRAAHVPYPASTSRVMAPDYVLPPFLLAMESEWVPKP